MALSRTLAGSGTTANTTENSSHDGTVDCGTRTNGDLLIVFAGGTNGNNSTNPWAAPAKSSGTATIGTVTQITEVNPAAAGYSCLRAWRIPVTGSGTLVLSYGDGSVNCYGCDIWVYAYTGHDTTTPVDGTVTAQRYVGGAGSSPLNFTATTATLTATPAAADEVLCFVNADADASTGKGWDAGSGFTQANESTSSSNYTESHIQYRTGSTSTTVTWPTDTTGGPTRYSVAGIAIIVKAAADSGVTGTAAATLAAATSTATGSFGPSGTSAQTMAAATSTASGWATVTGTVAVTLAALTSAATGSLIVTGTSAQTLAATTSTTTGNTTATGTAAVTLAAATSTATGTVGSGVTGTAAVTLAAATSSARGVQGSFAKSISGRRLLDHHGNDYVLKCWASWGLAQNLSNVNITTHLEGVEALGFNAVKVLMFGYQLNGTWTPYTAGNGSAVFTGTAYQSTLGSGWESMDWVVQESGRLGLTVIMSLDTAYGTTGPRSAIEAASNAQMTTFGERVATRYLDYENIVWDITSDDSWGTGTTIADRCEAFLEGIWNIEGDTRRGIRLNEAGNGSSSLSQYAGWFSASPKYVTVDSVYQYGDTRADYIDDIYGDSSYPIWDCEPPYVGNPAAGSANRQELRECVYAAYLRGAVGINWGHEDSWPFGATGLYDTGTWQDALTSDEAADAGRAFTLIDAYGNTAGMTRDSGGFLTSGENTGDTRAASCYDTNKALIYLPTSRSVTVDLTEFSGGWSACRVRKYDVTDGSYTDVGVYATTGSQVIGAPGTNASGSFTDWVLVFDGINAVTGTSAQTLAAATSTATGNTTATGTSAQTLADATSSAAGTLTISGTSAQTLADATSTATGSFTALGEVTGTSAQTLAAATSTASGSFGPSGTSAQTLADATSTATGSFGPSGTSAQTLADATSTASGWLPVTGTSAQTLAAATSTASGTAAGVTVADPNPGRPIQSRDPGPIKSRDPGPI